MIGPYRPARELLLLALVLLVLLTLSTLALSIVDWIRGELDLVLSGAVDLSPLLVLAWLPLALLVEELFAGRHRMFWAFLSVQGTELVPDLNRAGLHAYDRANALVLSVSGRWPRPRARLEISGLPAELDLQTAQPRLRDAMEALAQLHPHELVLSGGVLRVETHRWRFSRARALLEAMLEVADASRSHRRPPRPAFEHPRLWVTMERMRGRSLGLYLGGLALANALLQPAVLGVWALQIGIFALLWARRQRTLHHFLRFEGSTLVPGYQGFSPCARDEQRSIAAFLEHDRVMLRAAGFPPSLELELGAGDSTGDPAFDAVFRAKGPEVTARFGREARRALLALAALQPRVLTLSEQVLQVEVPAKGMSRERARALVEAMLAVSEALRTELHPAGTRAPRRSRRERPQTRCAATGCAPKLHERCVAPSATCDLHSTRGERV